LWEDTPKLELLSSKHLLDTFSSVTTQRRWRRSSSQQPRGQRCSLNKIGTEQNYARRMGQPTQRATNYTARSNMKPAQILLHANGQSAPRSCGACDVGRGAGSHTPSTASESFSHRNVHKRESTKHVRGQTQVGVVVF